MRSTSPSETEEGEERAAGFVLFRTLHHQRRYLLLKHQGDCHWGFPKGRLDADEGEMAAAVRETLEETGICDVVPVQGFRETSRYIVNRNGRRISKTATYFLAETTQSKVSLSTEHKAFQWLPFADAVRLLIHDESRRILTDAERLLAISDKTREQGDPQ